MTGLTIVAPQVSPCLVHPMLSAQRRDNGQACPQVVSVSAFTTNSQFSKASAAPWQSCMVFFYREAMSQFALYQPWIYGVQLWKREGGFQVCGGICHIRGS